jgi:hypothetical protein
MIDHKSVSDSNGCSSNALDLIRDGSLIGPRRRRSLLATSASAVVHGVRRQHGMRGRKLVGAFL